MEIHTIQPKTYAGLFTSGPASRKASNIAVMVLTLVFLACGVLLEAAPLPIERAATTQTGWVKVGSPPLAPQFDGLMSIIASGPTLFAATRQGIFSSADHGATWTEVNTGFKLNEVFSLVKSGLNLVLAADWIVEETPWATHRAEGFLISIDAGASWAELEARAADGMRLKEIVAASGQYIVARHSYTIANGSWYDSYVSPDSGMSWKRLEWDAPSPWGSIEITTMGGALFHVSTHSGRGSRLEMSLDSGGTWTQLPGPFEGFYLRSLNAIENDLVGYFDFSGPEGCYRSPDQGQTWEIIGAPPGEASSGAGVKIYNDLLLANNETGTFIWRNVVSSWIEIGKLPGNYLPYFALQSEDYLFCSAGADGSNLYRIELSSFLNHLAPAITLQPQSQHVPAGSDVTFHVSATGSPAPAFQWQCNGTDIPGQTSASLILTDVTSEQAGEYRVRVSNSAGVAISDVALLSVLPQTSEVRLEILEQQANGSVEVVLRAAPGGYWSILASSDLVTWSPVCEQVIPGTGAAAVVDPDAEGWEQRFYRAVAGEIPAVPAAPRHASATAGHNSIQLSWTLVEGAVSYNAYWSSQQGAGLDGEKIANVTGTSYTHTGVSLNSPHYYVVTAVNATGESRPGEEISAIILAVPASMQARSGNNQAATVGTAVAMSPSVVVRDAQNNPLSGVKITFVIASGGGFVTEAVAMTTVDGTAAVGSWTLGPAPGANTLAATSEGLTPVTFAATGHFFAAGAGTSQDPFLVATISQLDSVRHYLDNHFRLVADIDLDVVPYNGGAGWEPIGVSSEDIFDNLWMAFSGSFDGNNHTIRNLYMNRAEGFEGCGLFAVSTGVIKNLKLENVNVKGGTATGALTGGQMNGSIANCSVSGSIRGTHSVGGLAGVADSSGTTIFQCAATAVSVAGSGNNVGGLVGSSWSSNIEECHANAIVTGVHRIGGLVGLNAHGYIAASYSEGLVTGAPNEATHTGGLVGRVVGSSTSVNVRDCYSEAAVQGYFTVGGLLGSLINSVVRGSHAKGAVAATGNNAGGLVGLFAEDASFGSATIDDCYASGSVNGVEDAGGLVGSSLMRSLLVINQSFATGTVTGDRNVGGLIGYSRCDISRCHATGNVIGTGDNIGGFGGDLRGYAMDSYASGKVTTSGNYAGGFAGYGFATMRRSYAMGDVQGNNRVGGFTGWNYSAVFDSYATGNVEGRDQIGGFTGLLEGTIYRSYAIGRVAGISNVGGFAGRKHQTASRVENSYYNFDTSGQSDTGKGEARTTLEMKSGPVPGNAQQPPIYSGWDPAIWSAVDHDSYPILR